MSEPRSISCNLRASCLLAFYLGCLWELVSPYFCVCGVGTKQHDYRTLAEQKDGWRNIPTVARIQLTTLYRPVGQAAQGERK
jgi:hypothetical protein